MNSMVEMLNLWAGQALGIAWPMLWQSSLLIVVLFALDFMLRRKLRAAVRYALWLTLLLKLLLPPSFAFRSGVGWWLRSSAPSPEVHRKATLVVTYGSTSPLPPQT